MVMIAYELFYFPHVCSVPEPVCIPTLISCHALESHRSCSTRTHMVEIISQEVCVLQRSVGLCASEHQALDVIVLCDGTCTSCVFEQ